MCKVLANTKKQKPWVIYVDEAMDETYIVAVNSRMQDSWGVVTRLRRSMWDFVEREVQSNR